MVQPRNQSADAKSETARRRRWLAAVGLALLYGVVLITMLLFEAPPLALGLPLIPVVLAAVLYQIPGGLAAALLGALAVSFKATLDTGWPWPAAYQSLTLIATAAFFGSGALVGWISQRERQADPGALAGIDEQRRQFLAVLENIPVAVIVADQGGFLRLANQTALRAFGLTSPVALGQDIASVVPDKTLADLFYKATLGGEAVTGEVSGAGESILSASVSPLPGVGNVALLQDITHLKKLPQRKSEMISIVSHDLKNPLTAIQGYADLLIKMGNLNERQMKFMDRIRMSAARIIDLVTDLLDIAWIESGMETRRERTSLSAITRESVEGSKVKVATKALELSADIAATGVDVTGDETRLRQLVDNLIDYAIAHTEKGDTVTVAVRRKDDEVWLEVKDTGSSLSSEDLEKVFDRYFRVDESPEKVSGSGLGLAIVKAIAGQHGGSVEAESKEGKGSTFRVRLPAAPS